MEIRVYVPGSCGELVQGIYKGEPYLVTCPIEIYTEVVVSDSFKGHKGLGEKSLRALELVLNYLGIKKFPYGIRLTSMLPHGKGMASSSADIAAVCAGASAALGRKLTSGEIFKIAVAIEPTDPVFFSGLICANQFEGRVYNQYHNFPRLRISIFDTGGKVDTISFHQCARQVEADMPPPVFVSKSLPEMERQLTDAATASAFANEARLHKPCLKELVELSRQKGALGVNAAHSGTVLGVLWPEAMKIEMINDASAYIESQLPQLKLLCQTKLTCGGVFYK